MGLPCYGAGTGDWGYSHLDGGKSGIVWYQLVQMTKIIDAWAAQKYFVVETETVHWEWGSAGDTEAKAEVIVSLEFTGTQEEGS